MMIEEIRCLYPHPVALGLAFAMRMATGDAYCIGGALCRAAATLSGEEPTPYPTFPSAPEIATALQTLNPQLSRTWAVRSARAIILLTDAERYEDAWQRAALALTRRAA